MSGYDRHGASRDPRDDPRGDRGGYRRGRLPAGRVGRRASRSMTTGIPRIIASLRVEITTEVRPPSRRDSYPPRDGYGAGGPDRGDPGYGRFAPYDRGPGDRVPRKPRSAPRSGTARDSPLSATTAPPIADPPGSPSISSAAPRRDGPVRARTRFTPRARTTGTVYPEDRRAPPPWRHGTTTGGTSGSGIRGGRRRRLLRRRRRRVEDVMEIALGGGEDGHRQGGKSIKDLQERTGAYVLIHGLLRRAGASSLPSRVKGRVDPVAAAPRRAGAQGDGV